jgi:hypothetical protein
MHNIVEGLTVDFKSVCRSEHKGFPICELKVQTELSPELHEGKNSILACGAIADVLKSKTISVRIRYRHGSFASDGRQVSCETFDLANLCLDVEAKIRFVGHDVRICRGVNRPVGRARWI